MIIKTLLALSLISFTLYAADKPADTPVPAANASVHPPTQLTDSEKLSLRNLEVEILSIRSTLLQEQLQAAQRQNAGQEQLKSDTDSLSKILSGLKDKHGANGYDLSGDMTWSKSTDSSQKK